MRKIFSFLAIAAVVLTMAGVMTSCGGDEPEMDALRIEAKPLFDHVMICITPANNEALYISWGTYQSLVEKAGGLDQYIADYVASMNYDAWYNSQLSHRGFQRIVYVCTPEKEYCNIACFIVKDEETGKAKIVGTPQSVFYKMLPANTLNGEFSVSETKKVHFSSGNAYQSEAGFTIHLQNDQWRFYGSYQDYPRDLFQWGTTKMFGGDFFIPSREEWWYLFRERPNADELFGHATVNGIKGIIILPDDWKEPEGIHVKSCKEMGMAWDEETLTYMQDNTYDGYAQNVFDLEQWRILEFYGAVFLPAVDDGGESKVGHYWSATERSEKLAYLLCWNSHDMDLSLVSKNHGTYKTYYFSLRPVRVME